MIEHFFGRLETMMQQLSFKVSVCVLICHERVREEGYDRVLDHLIGIECLDK
jgi:hypothetical protein